MALENLNISILCWFFFLQQEQEKKLAKAVNFKISIPNSPPHKLLGTIILENAWMYTNNKQHAGNPILVTNSGSRPSYANSPYQTLGAKCPSAGETFHGFPKRGSIWEPAAWHRRWTPWSPWTDAGLSFRHVDNLCSRLCTSHPRIKIHWSVAPFPVIMQSALFSVYISTYERKLRNDHESNLEEHADHLCLLLVQF